MPLSVRNCERNTAVFAKSVNGDPVRITWGPHGTSNDTQRVPTALADDIDFLNSLEKGVLEVVDGPADIVQALQFETSKQREERARREAQAVESLDRRQDRDMVGHPCIGPGPAGRDTTCGRPVLIAHKDANEVPPLCAEHADLAPTFFLVEEGSRGEGATHSRDGVVRREWRQATIAPRATGR